MIKVIKSITTLSFKEKKYKSFVTLKEEKTYDTWRLRILISIIFGYGAYYLCRQNFSMIIPAYMEEFNYSKIQLGWILSFASIVYGIGKLVNGYISDRSNARYFMTIGLCASAIITFILGFTNNLFFLGFLWSINNWFQSMGWPPAARMLTHWFAPHELGTKWALGASSHQIGGAITLILSGYLIMNYGWRYAFFVPGIIAIVATFILFYFLRESPKDLDLPPIEIYKGDRDKLLKIDINKDYLTTQEIFNKVFINKNMWYICFANLCIYIIRTGIIFWIPLFLKEYKNISLIHAGWQVAAFEIIGLFGGFTAGWISDRIGGKRGIIGVVFMFCLALVLVIFWNIPSNYITFSTIALIFIGFFVYGPQILIGVASADFVSKKAIGTANGLAGIIGYVGSSLSGVCVGALIDNYGWSAAFIFFIVTAILGGFFFFLIYKAESFKNHVTSLSKQN